MPGVPPLEIEQFGIALADDEHRRTGGDDLPDNLPDPGDQPPVGGTRTMPMGLPVDAPLAPESFAVGLQQLLELSGCQQTAQRDAPEVVDEDIFGADQAIPLRPETHRIIVILEHGDVVLLVERTDSLVGLAPHREDRT